LPISITDDTSSFCTCRAPIPQARASGRVGLPRVRLRREWAGAGRAQHRHPASRARERWRTLT